MSREELRWLASRTFSDEHSGIALSEEELKLRLALEEEYHDEIREAGSIVKSRPGFDSLPYEDKINLAADLIIELHSKKAETKAKIR